MLIHNGKLFIQTSFENEDELEGVVFENYENIFGPSTIYLPKTLIKTGEGIGTVTDGFIVDLTSKQWFIVEAELGKHSVWNHIAPQVAKQIIAANQPDTKRHISNLIVEMMKDENNIEEKFIDEGIAQIDVRKVLDQIISSDPIIGMPIDYISADLREWAATVKSDVKLWLVRKYAELGNTDNIIFELPEEYRPVLDTKEEEPEPGKKAQFDVTILDLLDSGHLSVGETLTFSYKPKNGERKKYKSSIQEDGSIIIDDYVFLTPSYAALFVIQSAGSNRTSVNGWRKWKNSKGKSLHDLRMSFLGLA